jgi:hypothetical protein
MERRYELRLEQMLAQTEVSPKLPRKSGEAIAYLHDHHRQGLQNFVGSVPWDHKPLLAILAWPSRSARFSANPTA